MPPKKKRSCPFSSSKPRAKKKPKSEFDKEWAAKLAESDKGSFYQQEKWRAGGGYSREFWIGVCREGS